MKRLFNFSIIFCLLFNPEIIPQSNGNIPLMFKGKFNRTGGVSDVWGVQIGGINYALVTLDDGLSIVNTDDPYNPSEIVHINHENYPFEKLGIPDVETFTFGGITYAYLATYKTQDIPPLQQPFPLVMIINVNAAIAEALQNPPPPHEILVDPYNPSGNVYVGKLDDFSEIKTSHTLTIGGHYLYVATLNDSLPAWDLTSSPVSPAYVGFVTVNPSYSSIHEIYVKPLTSQSVRVFVASLIGGLQILDLTYIPMKDGSTQIQINNVVEHTYDFDRAYPNQRWSPFPFDFRFTHSVVPTDNEQYIFTTDEITLDWQSPNTPYSGGDPNLYSVGTLKSPRREGAFLRVWDKSLLGQDASFKGGYYVSEEHHWGITDLTQIDTTMVPNSIHQMFVRGNRMYLAHYTQGFRYLDISDPENIIELGRYDDYPTISFNPSSNYFFRHHWFNGIYGVFPDPNRTTICYAGGFSGGFYIFDLLAIPHPPTNLTVEPNGQGHYVLSWTPSPILNAQYYHIYRAAVPCCEPYDLSEYAVIDAYNGGNLVTSWEDVNSITGSGSGSYYYEISVENPLGRESVQSNRVAAGIGQPSKRTAEDETKENIELFDYSLSANYPNPFNPTTKIDYSIKVSGLVTLKVYDILGNEVAVLVDEMKEEGNHSITFNASDLPSGIYIYKLTAENFVVSKKLILLK